METTTIVNTEIDLKKSLNKVKIHQSMHIENVLKQPYFRT